MIEHGKDERMDIIELWQQYHGELLGYLRKSASSVDTAEDILSEVFLNAVRYQNTLVAMSPIQCHLWLYTSAKHKLIDLARNKKMETRIMPTSNLIEDDLSIVEVSGLISKIPDELQDLVAMRYFADMDSITIGKILGIPPATVRTRLRKACGLLRKYWNKE